MEKEQQVEETDKEEGEAEKVVEEGDRGGR